MARRSLSPLAVVALVVGATLSTSAMAAPPPKPIPKTEIWEDADDITVLAALGSMEMCETGTLPLRLIPVAGSLLSNLVEWSCLAPALLTVDYIQTFHGDRYSYIVQSGMALVAMKAFRNLVRLSSDVFALAAGVGYFLTLGPIVASVPILAPFFTIGFLAALGAGYSTSSLVRDWGGEWIFSGIFFGFTEEMTEQERREARRLAAIQPPLEPEDRFWTLMLTTVATEPDFDWWHVVPVAGTWWRAHDRADALKGEMVRVGSHVFGADRGDDEELGRTADWFGTATGLTAATGEALLYGGGTLFALRLAIVGEDIFAGNRFDLEKLGVLGWTGVGVLALGGLFYGAAAVLTAARPIVIPLAYGARPVPDELEPYVSAAWLQRVSPVPSWNAE